MALDLHAAQVQGFFDIPTDNLYAAPVVVRDVGSALDVGKVMVVSPDVGGVGTGHIGFADAGSMRRLAIVDKRRERPGKWRS